MKPKELTIRGLILGALITTVFTAANVYLGLKVGLTFASSIPAAVISMAISERRQRFLNPREQHRADRRLGGRHALGDHLRAAGTRDRRLVDGISILAIVSHLRERRRARRAVHDPAASRARHDVRPAVSGRRCGGRSAEGRIGHARRDEGRHRRSARRAHRRDPRHRRVGRTRHHHGDAHRRRRGHRLLPHRGHGVERIQHRVVARAARRGTSRRLVGRHGDA